MTDSTRAPGWYPDPWGTNDERYFDGSAWTRQTRLIGALDVAVQWPAVVNPVAPHEAPEHLTLDHPPPDNSPPGFAAPGLAAEFDAALAAPAIAPPGWHADPWRLASLRWWDGAGWTGHVSGPPAASVAVDVQSERALARWVQPLLLVGGLAQAAAILTSVSQAEWLAKNWDALTRVGGHTPTPPDGGSLGGLTLPITLAVGVLFLVWFHRAATTGWASGLPARRRPMLSTLAFFIPIVNWWWPYQATMDMVPADDGRRGLIRRWWALWVFGGSCGPLVYVAAAVFNESAARIVAVIGAVAMVAAGFAARAVVEYVTSAHEQLGRAAAAG